MNGLRRDPSLQELFDRILRLESEVVRLKREVIPPLKAENKVLTEKYEDLFKALKLEAESTTSNFATIYAALWPVVYKVFPGAAQADRALLKIRDSQKKKDKPD